MTELKCNTQLTSLFIKPAGEAVHPSFGKEGAFIVFEVGYNPQSSRSLKGIRSVIGLHSGEKLDRCGVRKNFLL